MQIQQQIEQKLREQFAPLHLEVSNESHMHNVPEGSESHFRVVLVSAQFEDQTLIRRCQRNPGGGAEGTGPCPGPAHHDARGMVRQGR